MSLFSSKKRAEREASAAAWDAHAERYEKEAREDAREAAKYRKSLKSGKSPDPAGERYLLRQHESNRRISEDGARDCRKVAEDTRKRWF